MRRTERESKLGAAGEPRAASATAAVPSGVVRKLRARFEAAEQGQQEHESAQRQQEKPQLWAKLEPTEEVYEQEDRPAAAEDCRHRFPAAGSRSGVSTAGTALGAARAAPEVRCAAYDPAACARYALRSRAASCDQHCTAAERDAIPVGQRARGGSRASSSPAQLRAVSRARSPSQSLESTDQRDRGLPLQRRCADSPPMNRGSSSSLPNRRMAVAGADGPEDTGPASTNREATDMDSVVAEDATGPLSNAMPPTHGTLRHNSFSPASPQSDAWTPARSSSAASARSSPGVRPPPGTWGAGEFQPDATFAANSTRRGGLDCFGEAHPVSQLVAKTVASSICEGLRTMTPTCCAMCTNCEPESGPWHTGPTVDGRLSRLSAGEVVVGSEASTPDGSSHRWGSSLHMPLEETILEERTESDYSDFGTPPEAHQRVDSSSNFDSRGAQGVTAASPLSGSQHSDSLHRESCEEESCEDEPFGEDDDVRAVASQVGVPASLLLQRESCDSPIAEVEVEDVDPADLTERGVRGSGLNENGGDAALAVTSPPRRPPESSTSTFLWRTRSPPVCSKRGKPPPACSKQSPPFDRLRNRASPLGSKQSSPSNRSALFRTPSMSCGSEWSAPRGMAIEDGEHMEVLDLPTPKLGQCAAFAATAKGACPDFGDELTAAAPLASVGRLSHEAGVGATQSIVPAGDALAPRTMVSYLAQLGVAAGMAASAPSTPRPVNGGKPHKRMMASRGPPSANLGSATGLGGAQAAGTCRDSRSPRHARNKMVYFPEPPVMPCARIYHQGHNQPWTPRVGYGIVPRTALLGRRGGA